MREILFRGLNGNRANLWVYGHGVTVQEGKDTDVPTKCIPVTERLPDVERLIAHWQSKADELKKSVEDACGEASTVSTYKWMHSLWRTVCEFVADLDDLATHCEINNYVENCKECGFCKKGEVAPVSWTTLPEPPKEGGSQENENQVI